MKAFYIPNGPLNIAGLFPTVNFNNVEEYYLEVFNSGSVDLLATLPVNYMAECKNCPDRIRIRFLNYLGTLDPLNFKVMEILHQPKSSAYQKPTTNPLDKSQHSISRFNVKSNDQYSVQTTVQIKDDLDRNYYDELIDSPLAWIETPDGYFPIVILDGDVQKIGPEDKFQYELNIKFKMSHERFIIRN